MQLPGPLRAVVGLVATAADEAKHLPDRAIELPMLAVSSALQMSLRAQQRYARLAARGDDVINRRPPGDEPPPWATFDEPVSPDEARAASQLLEELLGSPSPGEPTGDADGDESDGEAASVTALPVKRAPASKAVAKRVPPAKKTVAKKTVAKKTVAKKTVAKSTATKSTATKSTAPVKAKTISKPRHATPSRFDTVGDD